ncbi:dihydropteroate synthase [Tibeticola sp.]|uniref:dihydropteroate synthase n=1 Tax=Tibeticola sp. TaxID=2005368 RepID=UPI002585983F|nr:dihydropteroate synthase [Tibeticola sp.]MCI4441758.1 dihydropteroate synthase [Tibeticola sp.]
MNTAWSRPEGYPGGRFWQTARFAIDLSRPKVMGIVNVTPDSFSDGGSHCDASAALRHCEQLLSEGADMLDIGAEATRPGAEPVPLEQELERLEPVLKDAVRLGVPISVDTYKPAVMQRALDLGVDIINDVRALQEPQAAVTVARHPSCGVCLMHMHRDPQTMQVAPMEGDVVPAVRGFLAQAAARLRVLGVEAERIVLDPGIGFGKTVEQNFSLLARQGELLELAYPLLVGWSRKSSLGAVVAAPGAVVPPPGQRLGASVAAALLAVERGAAVVRVHDVLETVQAIKVWERVRQASPA